MQRPVVAAGRIVGSRRGLQYAILRSFRRQVHSAERYGKQSCCFSRDDAVDAAIQRPPDAARNGHDVADAEWLRHIVEAVKFRR
jgi:hypothetical protein